MDNTGRLIAGNKLVPLQNHGVKTMSIGYLLRSFLHSAVADSQLQTRRMTVR